MVKLLVDGACAAFYAIGGWKYKGAKIIALPSLLALYFAFTRQDIGLFLLAGSYQILRIGDGIPDASDPIGSWLGRIFKVGEITSAVAGALYATVGASLLVYRTHNFLGYAAYILLNAGIGFTVKKFKLKQVYVDLARGLGMGAIVWMA